MLQWPKKAVAALSYLFRPLQDIDVYVEDAGDEVFYRELLQKLLPDNIRLVRIFALGSRSNVIAGARAHDFNSRRALFLIDGDFEWLRGEQPPEAPGLYRLDAYCIENLLVQENSIVQIIIEEESVTEKRAREMLTFDHWKNQITEPLVNLFISFAALNLVAPTEPTTGLGVSRIITQSLKGKPASLAPSSRSNPTAFQAVRFEPPHPSDNGSDGGIQA